MASILACDTFEKKTHQRFALDILVASSAVQRSRQTLGRLPDTLTASMVSGVGVSGPFLKLVQYRKESDSQYVLWMHRADLNDLNRLPDKPTSTPEGATLGDIFARFDLEGDVIVASWKCIDCRP